MQDFNNIDDLFRKRLSEREVSYSASSWAGAEHLLNKHYRWQFLKKLLFVMVPVTVISAAGVVYIWTSDAGTGRVAEKGFTIDQPVKMPGMSSGNGDNNLSKTGDETVTAASGRQSHDETAMVDETAVLGADENIAYSIEPTAIPDEPKRFGGSQAPSENESADDTHAQASPDIQTVEAEVADVAVNTSKRTADLMAAMPVFSIRKIGAGSDPLLSDVARKPGEPLIAQLRKFEFGIEGGILVAQGFKNIAPKREGMSVGWHAALTANYHINQSVFLSSGIGVYSRGSLASEQMLLGSGGGYTLRPVSAYYLNIPVKLGLRFASRHTLTFSMQFNPLVNVVVTKETTSSADGSTDRKLMMDKAGFNGFDVAPAFGYRISLAERWDGMAEFQYGLFDVTDDQFFRSGEVNDQNISLRLGLSYRL